MPDKDAKNGELYTILVKTLKKADIFEAFKNFKEKKIKQKPGSFSTVTYSKYPQRISHYLGLGGGINKTKDCKSYKHPLKTNNLSECFTPSS